MKPHYKTYTPGVREEDFVGTITTGFFGPYDVYFRNATVYLRYSSRPESWTSMNMHNCQDTARLYKNLNTKGKSAWATAWELIESSGRYEGELDFLPNSNR